MNSDTAQAAQLQLAWRVRIAAMQAALQASGG